ncbi:MAG: phosphoenolpyruvate carboxykinase (GTP), partial [Sedimentibacter sp.]
SACGKTNLAMLIPPEIYKKKGYKVWTVGDDIAWLRIKEDGRLWAINPEAGFFGVAPGTNAKSNYNALMSTKKNAIFTNVVYNLDDDTVWWEKMSDNPPENGLDWIGNPWNGKNSKDKGAHPNSRFTAPAKNCPCISSQWESPEGVPLSAIIFGGRRAKTAPLVYQSRNWQHGVFVGSTLASETTAAAAGKVGVVRRDPMAMLPFCGYNMGDYFAHWLDMGTKMSNPPKIFHVNWFRTNKKGEFIWPGFGDNFRVLEWILKRCENEVEAEESPIGNIPKVEDINFEGINISKDILGALLKIDENAWLEDEKSIEEFYAKIGDTIPYELKEELEILKSNLTEALAAIVA